MESLECLPGRIEYKDKKNSENFKKFVDDYHKQHYPVSSRLRRWNAMTYVSAYAEVAANTALALAILCPSFGLAYIPRDYQENYKENIGRIIEDGFFSEHMSKIQRLLRY
ncbi:hypothetical protein H4217_001009 [Coemansia sp. RSA 1939]|nr:hypothetical protein H4217_001009 [Coemansia sp. RSA 1939]